MDKLKRKYTIKKSTGENKRVIRVGIWGVIKMVWNMYPVDKLEIKVGNDDTN